MAASAHLKGSDIPMGTVSPTLTDMKNTGTLIRDGLKVAWIERVKREGEAKASPKPDVQGAATPKDIFGEAQPARANEEGR